MRVEPTICTINNLDFFAAFQHNASMLGTTQQNEDELNESKLLSMFKMIHS